MRWLNMVAFLTVCVMAVTLYAYKNGTRQLQGDVTDLQSRIAEERNMIALLKTEWSHLTRPERLERLARQYLDMQPAGPDQVISPDLITGALPKAPAPGEPTDTGRAEAARLLRLR